MDQVSEVRVTVGLAKWTEEEEKGPPSPRGTGGWGQEGGANGWEGSDRGACPVTRRYAFLLDKALLICKRRGDTYDLKVFVNLHSFQVRDDSSGDRENKKVGL